MTSIRPGFRGIAAIGNENFFRVSSIDIRRGRKLSSSFPLSVVEDLSVYGTRALLTRL